jgi:hypothetical protein
MLAGVRAASVIWCDDIWCGVVAEVVDERGTLLQCVEHGCGVWRFAVIRLWLASAGMVVTGACHLVEVSGGIVAVTDAVVSG